MLYGPVAYPVPQNSAAAEIKIGVLQNEGESREKRIVEAASVGDPVSGLRVPLTQKNLYLPLQSVRRQDQDCKFRKRLRRCLSSVLGHTDLLPEKYSSTTAPFLVRPVSDREARPNLPRRKIATSPLRSNSCESRFSKKTSACTLISATRVVSRNSDHLRSRRSPRR